MPKSKAVNSIDIPETYRSYLSPQSKWMPAIDWNVKLFGAHTQEVPYGWKVPEESHAAFELMLILRGSQCTRLERIEYDLRQGDILLVPPGVRHATDCREAEGLHYFIAHFNLDDPLFRQTMRRCGPLHFRSGSENNERLKATMQKWVQLIHSDGQYTTADLFRIQAGLFEVLHLLADYASNRAETIVSPTAGHYATLIAQSIKSAFGAENVREQNFQHGEIRIEQIAADLGISSGYALEVFRQVYGTSPRSYLSELKLHEAKQLIQQPDLAFTAIAARLGYSTLPHFSRQFKRWTGMSPREYRQTLGRVKLI